MACLPEVTLLGIRAVGSIVGLFGLFFSAALLVVIFTLVRSLYLRDVLGEDVPIARHQTLFTPAGRARDSAGKLD